MASNRNSPGNFGAFRIDKFGSEQFKVSDISSGEHYSLPKRDHYNQNAKDWYMSADSNGQCTYSPSTVHSTAPTNITLSLGDLSRAAVSGQTDMQTVLTHAKLTSILHSANLHILASRRYLDDSVLVDQLQYNIKSAIIKCRAEEDTPREILGQSLEDERTIVNDWNGRLPGNATQQSAFDAHSVSTAETYTAAVISADDKGAFPILYSLSKVIAKEPLLLSIVETPLQDEPLIPPQLDRSQLDQSQEVVSDLATFPQDPETSGMPASTTQAPGSSAPTAMSSRMHEMEMPYYVEDLEGSMIPMFAEATDPIGQPEEHTARRTSETPRIPRVNDQLRNAPSPNIPFPQEYCNITIAEIICFLPQWLKSVDVVNRAISNGGSSASIADMLTSMRKTDCKKGISKNTVLRMMQKPMRRQGGQYADWTVGKHEPLPGHNPASISVAGFRTPADMLPNRKQARMSIPFKDLAKDVEMFPRREDALDLTFCIMHHMEPAHEHEIWNFPGDFQAFVQHLGGPMQVPDDVLDRAIFERWTPPHKRKAIEAMLNRPRDALGRLLIQAKEGSEDHETQTPALNTQESQSLVSNAIGQKRPRNQLYEHDSTLSPGELHHNTLRTHHYDSDDSTDERSPFPHVRAWNNKKRKIA